MMKINLSVDEIIERACERALPRIEEKIKQNIAAKKYNEKLKKRKKRV